LLHAALTAADDFKVCRSPAELPITAMDQYDPEYKRLRNRLKSQNRKNKQAKETKQSWGHKSYTNPAGHMKK
jgi:hypothetical protein